MNPLVAIVAAYQALLIIVAITANEYKSSFADELFTLIMLPFAFFYSIKKMHNIWVPFLIYVSIGFVSIFVSQVGGIPQPISGLYDLVLDMKLPVLFFGMLYFLSQDKQLDKTLRQVCWVFVAIGLLNLPFVLRDFLVNSGTGVYGQSLTPRAGLFQSQGLLRHHTDSVWRAYIATLCSLYLLSLRPSMLRLLLSMVLMVLTLIHLSTKEVIGLFCFCPLFFYGKDINLKKIWFILPVMVVMMIGVYYFTPFGVIIQSQFGAYFGADSYQEQARSVLTIQSYHIANDFFPFGSGSGTYASMPSYVLGYSEIYYTYGLYLIWGANIENPLFLTDVFWPKILGQTGWFGLIAYIVFFLRVFGKSFGAITNNRNRVAWLCSAISISVFLFSIAAAPYTQEFMMVVVVFFAAYMNIYAASHGRNKYK